MIASYKRKANVAAGRCPITAPGSQIRSELRADELAQMASNPNRCLLGFK